MGICFLDGGRMTNQKYEVGEWVFHADSGWGKIAKIAELINVDFKDSEKTFYPNGKYFEFHSYPSLLTKEQALAAGYPPPPKEKKKVVMYQALFWDHSDSTYHVIDTLFRNEREAIRFGTRKKYVRLLKENPIEIEVKE